MRHPKYWLVLPAAVLLASCASTPTTAPTATAAASRQAMPGGGGPGARGPAGYLPADTIDMQAVLMPAPKSGDARDAADRRIFRETRALQGTPRWAMAADDAELGNAKMLAHFACALQIELTPEQAPQIVRILQRATRDATAAVGKGKDFYRRKRPFLVDEGPICRPAAEVANSYDYPSGHTTAGWAWAMVLTQVAPERTSAILARGRAIGDSRVICGVHNASAVDSARFLTSGAVAAAMGTADYQADLKAAREELARLRAAPHATPSAAACEQEAALIRPYW